MSIDEVLAEFNLVYERSTSLARSVSSNSEPTREDILAIVHMVFARKDSEFERKMALEMAETQKLEAVYGRGYTSDEYSE
tara:strand:- start:483 stop:722 length:240 start_codon:yes stop_codon:yes gene_type:complete